MKKILILYYSGVGNTKKVAKFIDESIKNKVDCDVISIEKLPSNVNLLNYHAVIIGFPTIHSEPASPMMSFLDQLLPLPQEIPAFLFTTCGLYSANAIRLFAKSCLKKKIIPVASSSYRCPAVDGILLAPYMKIWFKSEKRLYQRISKDVNQFIKSIETVNKPVIPKVKWYSPVNYPNKVMGKKMNFTVHLHKDYCTSCGKCAVNCPVQAYAVDDHNYPVFIKEKCINCYRCIHHCQSLALSLSKRKRVKKTIADSQLR